LQFIESFEAGGEKSGEPGDSDDEAGGLHGEVSAVNLTALNLNE
jgi:hypothetical protein